MESRKSIEDVLKSPVKHGIFKEEDATYNNDHLFSI